VNAADNIGSTPLHEAVNASQEVAVKLLLDYQPLPTLDRYVTGAAGGSQGRRPPGSVDLTAMAGAEEKFTPLQDAVEAGNINIVTIILGMWELKMLYIYIFISIFNKEHNFFILLFLTVLSYSTQLNKYTIRIWGI
jgi:hypothetical protein